jgi:hypothetical protein
MRESTVPVREKSFALGRRLFIVWMPLPDLTKILFYKILNPCESRVRKNLSYTHPYPLQTQFLELDTHY